MLLQTFVHLRLIKFMASKPNFNVDIIFYDISSKGSLSTHQLQATSTEHPSLMYQASTTFRQKQNLQCHTGQFHKNVALLNVDS